MKKWMGIAGIVAVAAIGVGSYFAYDNSEKHEARRTNPTIESKVGATGITTTVNEPVDEFAPAFLFKEVLTKQQIEKKYPLDMAEKSMQKTLHEMTHQKIKADQKWGLTPITPERIKRLLQVVEANKSAYEKEDAYLDMLNNWIVGNFDGIDLQHDTIWAFQEGTVGQAFGVFTPAEEEAFIKENYEVLAKGAD
ncbi:DUF6241 domain-containing protein [Bacillus sp. FJAT-27245]|uniref:DUF6241 domain-containing protein n=1 Tax=Bacillus sp. FJAT-27245 TaxID=1684144 RepID=UPI0006A7B9A6|nr:DUF6241 domain-containing protein [Bacillus sp. FJAT-27245]